MTTMRVRTTRTMTTTDEERAARIAAMRAKRAQPPVETATIGTSETPTRAKHPHVAAGARIVATGLTASAVFGITTVLAAAAQPAGQTTVVPPQPTAAPLTAAPLMVTPAVVDTTSPNVETMVVLTIPPLATSPAQPAPAQSSQPTTATTPTVSVASPSPTAAPTAAPVAATAPAVTAAPAPVPTQPPPPAATTAPSA